jgi:hypothetical protein
VKKGFGANIDNLPKAGLGQGFGFLDFGLRKKWGDWERPVTRYQMSVVEKSGNRQMGRGGAIELGIQKAEVGREWTEL